MYAYTRVVSPRAGVSRGGAAAARARDVALLLPPARRAARARCPRARPRRRPTPAHAVISEPARM